MYFLLDRVRTCSVEHFSCDVSKPGDAGHVNIVKTFLGNSRDSETVFLLAPCNKELAAFGMKGAKFSYKEQTYCTENHHM